MKTPLEMLQALIDDFDKSVITTDPMLVEARAVVEAAKRQYKAKGEYVTGESFVCDCGLKITLDDPLTNECPKCGRFWNSAGQQLDANRLYGSYGEFDEEY